MIPDTPPGSSLGDIIDYYDKVLSFLESRSQLHETWYTHKNSKGAFCWICDLLLLCRKLVTVLANLEGEKPINYPSHPTDKHDSANESDRNPEIDDGEVGYDNNDTE